MDAWQQKNIFVHCTFQLLPVVTSTKLSFPNSIFTRSERLSEFSPDSLIYQVISLKLPCAESFVSFWFLYYMRYGDLPGSPGWTQAFKIEGRECLWAITVIPSYLHFQKWLGVCLHWTSSLYFSALLWWLFPLPWLCGSRPSSWVLCSFTLANQISWDSVSKPICTMS